MGHDETATSRLSVRSSSLQHQEEHWDIRWSPAKKHMVAGTMVPTVRGAFAAFVNKKRRIILQKLSHPVSDTDKKQKNNNNDNKTDNDDKTTTNLDSDDDWKVQPRDRIVVKILKPRKHWGFARDSDDSSDEDDDDDDKNNDNASDSHAHDSFLVYRHYDWNEVSDMKVMSDHNGAVVEAAFGRGNAIEVREMTFDSSEAAQAFVTRFQTLSNAMETLAEQQYQAFRESSGTKRNEKTNSVTDRATHVSEQDEKEMIHLLVEIVSAVNLPVADIKSTDPFVSVFLGPDEVHRTKPIPNNTNPIWTVDNGSLFILSCPTEDLFKTHHGLTFRVMDKDTLTKDELLGSLVLTGPDLMRHGATSAPPTADNREEYTLDQHYVKQERKSTKDQQQRSMFRQMKMPPKLVLRIRPATSSDVKFMKQLHAVQSSKKAAVYLDQAFVAPKLTKDSGGFMKRDTKKDSQGQTLVRVKPCPDPLRPPEDTTWMTKEQLEIEHMKPSSHWIEAGSGTLGRLFLEILHCDNLPNKDKGLVSMGNNQTDAFCAVCYEDAMVHTHVVTDELSPRWMPWCQRGFVFHIQHPSSQLLVGVLDHDSSIGDAHDPVGRVAIDVTNLRADTDYILSYDLHESVLMQHQDDNDNDDSATTTETKQPTKGTLTVRLRIEWKNYRSTILASLKPPPTNYINVACKKDFKTTYFVCHGDENSHSLNMDALKTYGNELSGYADISYYVVDAFMIILLWRGHYPINFFGLKFSLPLHSIIAFVMGITLIENFNLLPSYSLFAISWFMLATNEYRQHNPSPWHGSMTFRELWYSLLVAKSSPRQISQYENEAAIRRFEEKTAERQKQHAADKQRRAENAKRLNEFLTNDDEKDDDDNDNLDSDLSTKVIGRPSLNPLKPILLPIQKTLGMICKALRVIRSIITWDESLYAFALTNFCLVMGIFLIWVPWDLVLRWTARVVLWCILGPWMKLVDIFHVSKVQGNEKDKPFQAVADERLSAMAASKAVVMKEKETILKTSALKRFMFGKFVTKVPQFKEHRYIPRPESTATPRDKMIHDDEIVISGKIHGQMLVGKMIPRWADEDEKTNK